MDHVRPSTIGIHQIGYAPFAIRNGMIFWLTPSHAWFSRDGFWNRVYQKYHKWPVTLIQLHSLHFFCESHLTVCCFFKGFPTFLPSTSCAAYVARAAAASHSNVVRRDAGCRRARWAAGEPSQRGRTCRPTFFSIEAIATIYAYRVYI